MSRYRPLAPIIVVTRDERVARQLHLFRGCFPLYYPEPKNPDISWMEDVDARINVAVKVHNMIAVVVVTYMYPSHLPFIYHPNS